MNIKKERLVGVLLISMFLLTLPLPTARAFDYPPIPLLNVSLGSGVIGGGIGNTFWVDVMLMGENGENLDPFWDIAGFDIVMNFNPAVLRALTVTIDPDGWFDAFWPAGIAQRSVIDTAAGTVSVMMAGNSGPGGVHTAPFGRGRLFTVRFREIGGPAPVLTDITLRSPRAYVQRTAIDADAGIIDLTDPVGTQWLSIAADDYGRPLSLDDWVDADADSELSPGDDLILNDTSSGYWHPYTVHDFKGTLDLTHLFTGAVDDYIWVADFSNAGLENFGLPGRTTGGGTGEAYNGYGNPYWTGNFSLIFPVKSVNSITAHYLPFTGDEYTQVLVEGVDYVVHDEENLVELLIPQDVDIIDEHWIDGVTNKLNGWPFINYVASGIQSVYRKFPYYVDYYGETEGFAANAGFEGGLEWWYEPDWPWELEGWWALGYFKNRPYSWPVKTETTPGTEWWINYTAASYLTVDFNADPDPRPYYVEYNGTYEEFLEIGDPIGTTWYEVYPNPMNTYELVGIEWSTPPFIVLQDQLGNYKAFTWNKAATDVIVDQVRTIDDIDLESPFYGMEPIVNVAGFPHPEREMSPWHNSTSSMPIPHTTGYIVPNWPTAQFTVSPRYAKINQDIRFDASGNYDPDGTIVSYAWDFGDGATSPLVTVKHAYAQAGFYTTTLTVTDDDGVCSFGRKTIAVQPLRWEKAEHPRYFVSKDEDAYNDLTARVMNYGTAAVYVQARFTTYDRRTGFRLGEPLDVYGMAMPGTEIDLTVGWKPADHEWDGTRSVYTVRVELILRGAPGSLVVDMGKINFEVAP